MKTAEILKMINRRVAHCDYLADKYDSDVCRSQAQELRNLATEIQIGTDAYLKQFEAVK